MTGEAARFAARYGAVLDDLGADLAADDDVLGFDPAGYAEASLPPLPGPGTGGPRRLAEFDAGERWGIFCSNLIITP